MLSVKSDRRHHDVTRNDGLCINKYPELFMLVKLYHLMSIYSSINPMLPTVWSQEAEALPQVWGGSAAGADIVERSQARVEFRKSHEIPVKSPWKLLFLGGCVWKFHDMWDVW
jgi:hypothetical protein